MSCAEISGRSFRGRGESEGKDLETGVCGFSRNSRKAALMRMAWERGMFVEDEAR